MQSKSFSPAVAWLVVGAGRGLGLEEMARRARLSVQLCRPKLAMLGLAAPRLEGAGVRPHGAALQPRAERTRPAV